MATADQLKALIKSHFDEGPERFNSLALQVAAHEASLGHKSIADDIYKIIESEKKKGKFKIITLPKDLTGLIIREVPKNSKSSLVISSEIKERLDQIILEYKQRDKLKQYSLKHRRKILLVGSPGTGKTMTANILAKELNLTLNTIQLDQLITKYMGETSVKLRQIFDEIKTSRDVYLFDEFDAIGGERSRDNDVGEMRRVLNSFLQFLEQDTSDSIIIAITNNPKLLDTALFRRFDDMLYYELPDDIARRLLIKNSLNMFYDNDICLSQLVEKTNKMCHADIVSSCVDAVKRAVLKDTKSVTTEDVLSSINNRLVNLRD